MTRILRTAIATLAFLALLASACGEPALTVQEYATAIEAGTDAYISEAQGLSLVFHQTVEDEIALLAAEGEGDLLVRATNVTKRETAQYLALLEDAMLRYVSALKLLRPPPTISEVHEAYVLAFASVQESMPETRDAVGSAEDLDGIQIAITGSGFSDGQLRLRTACVALETAVRAEGQGLDLGCTRPPGIIGQP